MERNSYIWSINFEKYTKITNIHRIYYIVLYKLSPSREMHSIKCEAIIWTRSVTLLYYKI